MFRRRGRKATGRSQKGHRLTRRGKKALPPSRRIYRQCKSWSKTRRPIFTRKSLMAQARTFCEKFCWLPITMRITSDSYCSCGDSLEPGRNELMDEYFLVFAKCVMNLAN